MGIDEIIGQLSNLSIRAGRAPAKGDSNSITYNDKGELTVQQLRSHLRKVRLHVSKVASPQKLREVAKQEAKGLLRIAQAGLKNTAGGLEPLRLAYEAMLTVLPLAPFVGAADLTMEKLWYQIIARSVDLGEFMLGLGASASLQTCLKECHGDVAGGRKEDPEGAGYLEIVGEGGGKGEELRLGPFARPVAGNSMDVAKLVSGASLNTCRCCLEVGSRKALGLMTGNLGRSAGRWIDVVGELGDSAKAEAYRDHLFKLLWRGCSSLEQQQQQSLSTKPRQCLIGRQTALRVLLRKRDSWSANVFVAHSHRAAVALERAANGSPGAGEAAELSAFCLEAISDREGTRWPAEVGREEVTGFQSTWVDWLQHSATLQEKVANGAEVQRLLQLAHDYVIRCLERRSGDAAGHGAAECAAYASMLKMHAAVALASQHPRTRPRDPRGASATSQPPSGKQVAKKRAGKQAAACPSPSSVIRGHALRGFEFLGDVVDCLGKLVTAAEGSKGAVGPRVAGFVGAAVKAWRWAQRCCGVIALWVDQAGGGGVGVGGKVTSGELEGAEWLEANLRGLRVLAELSRNLSAARRVLVGDHLERVPTARSFCELAVESYLRSAHIHLTALASASKCDPAGAVRSGSHGSAAADGALQALTAVKEMCGVDGNGLPSQFIRRMGAGYFGLGTSLLDCGKLEAGLEALARGCRFLERWVIAEVELLGAGPGAAAGCGGSTTTGAAEILRTAQLDLRLSKLSKALQDSADPAMAAAAAARALAFCPELWRVTPDGQPDPDPPGSALALVERYVGCRLRCRRSACAGAQDRDRGRPYCSSERVSAAAATGVTRMAGGAVSAYLLGGGGPTGAVGSVHAVNAKEGAAEELSMILARQGLPSAAIAWVLLEVCRVYRSHLPLCVSEGTEGSAGGNDRDTISACIEGHRRAVETVLGVCQSSLGERDCSAECRRDFCLWKAHARVAAAKFEHDLLLAGVAESAADTARRVMADLPRGVCRTTSGAAATSSKLGTEEEGEEEGSPFLSPAAAAAAGILACTRAMALRDLTDRDDDVKAAMRRGLEFLCEAARDAGWKPERAWPASARPTGAGSVVAHLKVLEAHYTLHGDAARRAKVGEVKVVLADAAISETKEDGSPQDAAASAAALGSVGAALQSAGLPVLGSIYSAVALDKLRQLEGAGGHREGAGAGVGGAGAGISEAPPPVQVETAQITASIVRGLCLAERRGSERDGESVLLEARGRVSGSVSKVMAQPSAAYLECMAGMGLAWSYERSGRLVEAMGELRQVLRLCHAWASTGSALSPSDRQIVPLSAARGASILDDSAGEGAAAAGRDRAEEGIGEESGDVEETAGDCRDGRKEVGVALSSQWIPIYLEGLARMGRLWRARGFASKASGYLRQGCVASEPLHAARFLRRSLLEEVEVAAGMHRFDRAERLLGASEDLLRRELQEMNAVEDGSAPLISECATCKGFNPARGEAVGPGSVAAAKGKGSKRGAKKGGGNPKSPPPPSVAVSLSGPCIRCREVGVNAAELAAAEALLLQKRGDFEGAFAACERGQAAFAPLIRAAAGPVQLNNSLSFARVSSAHGLVGEGGGTQALGWRALETLAALRLQQGRAACLLGDLTTGKKLLEDCSGMEGAPALVRAAALYRLGRLRLDAGDAAGAIPPLEAAEALTRGAGAPKLVRKIRRVLAVASTARRGKGGADSIGVDGSWGVAALASLSIGVTHCNQVTHATARRSRKGDAVPNNSGIVAGLKLFDVVGGGCAVEGVAPVGGQAKPTGFDHLSGGDCLQEAVTTDLRPDLPIVSLCLAPGGGACRRLLVTRLARGRPPLTASVPLPPEDAKLLGWWGKVMEENRNTLRGHSAEEAAAWGNKEKARWWERRVAVDEGVGALLGELQERWLAAHGLAAVLLGGVVGERLGSKLEGVFEFARSRIVAARGVCPGVAVKGSSRAKGAKGAKRPRGAANPAGGGGVGGGGCVEPGEGGGLSSGLAELIRVCVHGGDVMGEEAWRAVVRLALPEPGNEGAAEEISGKIHQKVRAVFDADWAEDRTCREVHLSFPPKVTMGNPRPIPDIERGRSASTSKRAEAAGSAVAVKPASTVFQPSIDGGTLSKMKVADLRRELSARGVPTTGLKLKADLLARLTEVVQEEARGSVGVENLDGGGGGCSAGPKGEKDRDDWSGSSRSPPPDRIAAPMSAETARRNSGQPAAPRSQSATETSDSSACGEEGDSGSARGGCCAERHPVVLVLDEELQSIPWEGLPCLRGRAVTRVPAIPFVFSALAAQWDGVKDSRGSREKSDSSSRSSEAPSARDQEQQTWLPSRDGVRLSRGYYVLDPEANLPHTRKQLGPVFEKIERRLGWSGVQGTAPTEEQMAHVLQDVDMFAYCGHGAGELLVGREAVSGFKRCAVAVLMGCSSGRLKGYGDFEPLGMVSSYLTGGSPAVVANLWDVTDRDIDRYSVALLEAFMGGGGGKRALTLAHAVAEARSECKMPFIIGHAPVCYGIPVVVSASSLTR